MERGPNYCTACGEAGHNRRLHDDRSPGVEAGRLVYEEGLTFAEAGRRVGVSRQAAYKGWRRYVQRRDLERSQNG